MTNLKNFEIKTNQENCFIYGDGNSKTKNNLAKSEKIANDEDTIRKLNPFSPYDIKVRRRRVCQMKSFVILMAIFFAACMSCLISYYYIKFNGKNLEYLRSINCKFDKF